MTRVLQHLLRMRTLNEMSKSTMDRSLGLQRLIIALSIKTSPLAVHSIGPGLWLHRMLLGLRLCGSLQRAFSWARDGSSRPVFQPRGAETTVWKPAASEIAKLKQLRAKHPVW